MKRVVHLLVLLLLLPGIAIGKRQGKARVDSLVLLLPGLPEDTAKVIVLDDLSNAYKTIDPEQGMAFAQQALHLATRLEWKPGIAHAYSRMGLNCQFKYDYPKSLIFNRKALALYKELGLKSGMATVETSLANVYSQMGNYKQGLEYNMGALAIFEELNDKKSIATTQGNIGNIYQVLKDYPKALAYDMSALRSFEDLDDRAGIARNLGNIGNIYLQLKDYEGALTYSFKALAIFEALGERNGQGLMSGNIGEIYLEKARDTTLPQPVVKINYVNKNESLEKAIIYLEKGTAICKEISLLGGVMEFSMHLSEAYKMSGNYKDALRCARTYANVKDSVFSRENIQKIALNEGLHEKELREKELEVQELQILAGRNEKRYYLAGLSLLMVLSVGLYRRSVTARKNRERLEEKNNIIAAEKELADVHRIRAEKSEQFKQQFLANMSHEIRTPMNAVSGMTDLLLDNKPRPDQLHYLQAIAHSSDALLHIIKDILDLSKIEAGKLELEHIDFRLTDATRYISDTLSFRAEEKGLSLTTTIDSTIPLVLKGDPFRLQQILMNLTGNAIKFTEKGTVAIDVLHVKTEKDRTTLLFKVSDTGIGIPAERMNNLFENFSQTQASDTRIYGGTGLGLAISRQLVNLLGGTIDVVSEVGSGTVFSFKLSFLSGSAEKLLQKEREEKLMDGKVLKGLRILLADDNDYNRLVVTETLKAKAEVNITEVTNGQEAIDCAVANDYDVILMDIQMPVLNGIDAATHIRNQLPTPKNKIPIIALTASLPGEDVEKYLTAGIDKHLVKPFRSRELLAALADATGRKTITTGEIETPSATPAETIHSADANNRRQTVTDLAYLHGFCDGDHARMNKFIRVYITSVPAFTKKMDDAIASGNRPVIATLLHTFKPRWRMMGMIGTGNLAAMIERKATEFNDDELKQHLQQLLEQVNTSVDELKDFQVPEADN
jgi:signal transduction histidine kinase/DNA-binding response OmpR family regulator